MTLNDLQRAALVLYAARAAGKGASLEQMKAICYCIRNRVHGGWYDGNWLTAIEHAGETAGNPPGEVVVLDPNSRILQRLVSDVDDIYYGGKGRRPGHPDHTAQGQVAEGGDQEDALRSSYYWFFVDRPSCPWFIENIVQKPGDHPMRSQMGTMMFFE